MIEDDSERSIHAHPLEVMSLTVGILLMLTGLAFALFNVNVTEIDLGWLAFGGLVAAGAITLAAAVRRHRASGTAADDRPI